MPEVKCAFCFNIATGVCKVCGADICDGHATHQEPSVAPAAEADEEAPKPKRRAKRS